MSLRFRVALSFPGEHRAFVAGVAERLGDALGRDRVLYDAYYEAEFARTDLDSYLLQLYHDESELIVVFLSAEYERKSWCRLEWRAVRDLIAQRSSAIMPLRFDNTKIPGLFSIDGYFWIGDRRPEEVAEKILERLGIKELAAGKADQKIEPSRLTHVPARLFGREQRLADLEAAWRNPAIHVVTLVAWGGVGKTSLVAKWADSLGRRGYEGADYFDWSFYSQGASATSHTSADPFIDAALRFFGDTETADSAKSAWDKGSQLAKILAKRRALLVLDGLEPLQHPPGPLTGQLKDPAITALLRGLAQRNAGLCVVTTRARVVDLGRFEDGTAPKWELELLSTTAGVELLKSLGVHGFTAELAKAVVEVKGHSLTLNLLGRYLKAALDGDVRQRDLVPLDEADEETQNGHAFRVIASYEKWFEREGEKGWRQLAVLRLIGLFDRPASAELLAVLRREPAIEGLTDAIAGLSDPKWQLSISRLIECNLIAEDNGALDAHPLIREYFGRRLRETKTDGWRAAHGRLFDHLKEKSEYWPEGLTALQPLYQAVFHGCLAGRQQEACVKVYRDRIQRGDDAFSTFKLGAIGADLGAVACFFKKLWSQLAPSLSEGDQAYLLNEAAFSLRGLGRLREAIEPMRAVLDVDVCHARWREAATSASNLSQLNLMLGEIKAAVADAEQSVVFADRSKDAFQRISKRTTLSHARHQAGEEKSALTLFREAERLQGERQPHYPQLYSLPGFRYCDLLLSQAERAAGSGRDARAPVRLMECGQVERRAAKALEIAKENSLSLLTMALDHLTLGRCRLYRTILDGRDLQTAEDAQDEIETAVDGLRAAGQLDDLPRGLLTRAWLRFAAGDAEGARADLDEAQEIAERGLMRLHLADVALYRARFFLDRAALAEARRLVEECGYGRRRAEIADVEEIVSTSRRKG